MRIYLALATYSATKTYNPSPSTDTECIHCAHSSHQAFSLPTVLPQMECSCNIAATGLTLYRLSEEGVIIWHIKCLFRLVT